jgi:hypothetical protein
MKHFLYKKIIFCPLFNNRARYQSLLKLARRTSYLALGEKLGCRGLIVISFANPISRGVLTNFATSCGKVGTRYHVLRENPTDGSLNFMGLLPLYLFALGEYPIQLRVFFRTKKAHNKRFFF